MGNCSCCLLQSFRVSKKSIYNDDMIYKKGWRDGQDTMASSYHTSLINEPLINNDMMNEKNIENKVKYDEKEKPLENDYTEKLSGDMNTTMVIDVTITMDNQSEQNKDILDVPKNDIQSKDQDTPSSDIKEDNMKAKTSVNIPNEIIINTDEEEHKQLHNDNQETNHEDTIKEIIPCETSEIVSNKDSNPSLAHIGLAPEHLYLLEEGDKMILNIMNIENDKYNDYEKIYEDLNNQHRLCIYLKSYVDKYRINKLYSEFNIPCTPEQFIYLMSNIEEQKILDNNIDQYQKILNFTKSIEINGITQHHDYSIVYLAYKKLLIASARDFVYFKHCTKIDDNTWCDTSKSIIYNDIPEYNDKVRGNIILSGYIIHYDGNNNSRIKLYSECDFKMNIPLFIAKSFIIDQSKKYIEKCINRIKQLYPQSPLSSPTTTTA